MLLPILIILGLGFSSSVALDCDINGKTPAECYQQVKSWEHVYVYPKGKN